MKKQRSLGIVAGPTFSCAALLAATACVSASENYDELGAIAEAEDFGTEPAATVALEKRSNSSVTGNLSMTEVGAAEKPEIRIEGKITGLMPGSVHGFHIHEKGDCSAPDAASAGGHFNPAQGAHGIYTNNHPELHHAGDLGNVTADDTGTATVAMTVPNLTLRSGSPSSIVGRSIIVHEKPDDLKTQPTGGAGARYACGVIALDQK